MKLPPFSLLLAGAVALAPRAFAETVVTTGDDLLAIVQAAPDGEVIRIDSDAAFEGTLIWSGKSLTIRAGDGFQPVLMGQPEAPAIALGGTPNHPTRATLIGLTIQSGGPLDPLNPPLAEYSLRSNGTGTAPDVVRVDWELEDCRLVDEVTLGGTGIFETEFLARTCDFQGQVTISSIGDSRVQAEFLNDCSFERVFIGGSGQAAVDVRITSAEVAGALQFGGSGDVAITGNFRRSQLRGGLVFFGLSNQPSQLLVESCLVTRGVGSLLDVGVIAAGTDALRLVNSTVTGWDVGLELNSGVAAENLAVFDNAEDVSQFTPAGSITNSLVADGSFTGSTIVNGTPLWTANFALVAGSLGVDQGNSDAANLGLFDVYGDPRIQDGDGDGTPAVNFGAVESLGNCQIASFFVVNGSGTNPLGYTPDGPAVLGQTFSAQVATEPSTVLTLLGFDQPSPVPFPVPGIQGEVLLAATPGLILDTAPAGSHQVSVPQDSQFCGATLMSQGFRVNFDLLSGLVETQALNGAELTLGS